MDRIPDSSGHAADLGTACHEALEDLMTEVWPAGMANATEEEQKLMLIFRDKAVRLGLNAKQIADGEVMLRNWLSRCGRFTEFWEGRTILAMEKKETFPLTIGRGEHATTIPVTYIWDRCDEVETDGPRRRIEIIDYKSFARPVSPGELAAKPQVRIYALAAALKFMDPETRELPDVWVKLDLLRYDIVGVKFTRNDHMETLKWLRKIYREILADDGTEERINPQCKWCVRRLSCKTLELHSKARGIYSLNVDEAAELLYKTQCARQALSTMENELTEIVMDYLEEETMLDHSWSNGVRVQITASGRREIDSGMAARVVGPDLVAKYGRIGVTQIDAMKKAGELTAEQRAELDRLVTQNVTPKLRVNMVGSEDE